MKKAQASTEYLIILAVVLIIALAVVGVLGGFPTLTAGVSEKDSLAYWKSTDVGIDRIIANNGGNGLRAVLRNNKDFAVKVTSIVTTSYGTRSSLAITLQPGQTSSLTVLNNTAFTCTAGSTVSIAGLQFVYEDAANSALSYTFSGAKNLVATCQA